MNKRSALHVIRHEHQVLSALLHALTSLASDDRHGSQRDRFDAMRAILFYIDEFPERLHHTKESDVLFPLLRERFPDSAAILDRLDQDHARGATSIRDLEHALLGWEQMGEARREAFLHALERYVSFYRAHMHAEETQALPLAEQHLTDADWQQVDQAFAANRDPLTGHEAEDAYRPLFQKIVQIAPPPIGVGN